MRARTHTHASTHTHTRSHHTRVYTHVPRVRLCGRRHGRTMTSRRPSRGLFWGRNGGKGFGQTASPGGFKFFIIFLSLSTSNVPRFVANGDGGGGEVMVFYLFSPRKPGLIVISQRATVLRTGIRGCYGPPRSRAAEFEYSFLVPQHIFTL